MDTSGFYKWDGDLIFAPNFVYGPFQSYELHRAHHASYTYPVDGWWWFETEEEARAALEPPPVEEPTE
jgi:hypothetical protein